MSTSDEICDTAGDLNAMAKDTVRMVSDQLSDQANVLRDATAAARYNTEDFIRTNPWQSITMAVGLGFVIGCLVARR